MSVYDHVFSTLSLAVTQIGAKTSNADFTHSSKVLFRLGWLIKWGNLKFRKRMTNTLTSWTLKFHHSVAHSFPRKCDGMTVIVKNLNTHALAHIHMENCQLFSTGYRIGRYFYNSIRTLFSRISSIHRFSTVSHQKFTSNVRERKNNEKYVQIKLNLMKLFVRNSNYSDDMFEFFLFFFLSDLDIWIWELTHWRKEREGEDWITVARGYASHNINTYA